MVGYTTDQLATQAELGIELAHDATGHGYAKSALTALLEHIEPNYQRIYAECNPGDERSQRLLEHSGFTRKEGIVQRYWGPAIVFEYASGAR